ncbi:hypothetical protein FERRO_18050 [Ferrovum sp. JA12]|uniref:HvfC/BufC family peptide modification chaperone n=1 Tax=Ferrovum sp. JA12 TaxID=1356299 RepID=UPI000702F53B|nr:putative DNA-binding domain-containing protein [Ferrovum sp. JA12]KRH78809.1 hypothetical protein FERRO_18050 [Ferrovum sp. JA12]
MSELLRQIALFDLISVDQIDQDIYNGITVYQRHFHRNFLDLLIQKYPVLNWLIGTNSLTKINYDYFFKYPTHSGNITTYGDQLDSYLEYISLDQFNMSFLLDLVKFEKQLFYSSVVSEFDREIFELSILNEYDPSSFTFLFVEHLSFFQTEWSLIDVYNAYKSNEASQPVISSTNYRYSIAIYFLNTNYGFKLQIEQIEDDYIRFQQYLKNHSLLDALELMSDEFDFHQWLTYVTSKNWITGILLIDNSPKD